MQNNIGGGAKCRREATEPQLVPLLGPRTRASGRRAFDRRHEAVAYTLFVYNPPPPPRRCIWAYSSLIHPDVSAFPERVVGSRYASTSSRLCLVAFTHVVACTLARSAIRDPLADGFSRFVASMTAPVASRWSDSPGGARTHWSAAFSRRTPKTDIPWQTLRHSVDLSKMRHCWRGRELRMTEDELKIVRRAYAMQIMAAVQIAGENIESSFAQIPREDFLGPGPWPIFRRRRNYVLTPADDPVYLYTDEVVGIVPERHINNGQPSLHAYLLGRAAPREGDHIVHVGAGVGYYTAIMAHVVGPSGRVTAIEFEPDLAARAKANLANYTNVCVIHGDGSTALFEPADVIYVNAGATRPADAWLAQLKNSGRLILPLTTDKGFTASDWSNMHLRGAVFLVVRQGTEFHTQWISPVAIYPCHGMRDMASENALAAAFERGGWKRVKRLYRTDDVRDERCWLRAPGWCLAYE